MDLSQLSRSYTGTAAHGYDERRRQSEKWTQEHAAIADLLGSLPHDLQVLDVPVGTGRFFDLYAGRGFSVTGVDSSSDMIAIASRRAAALQLTANLVQGDIFRLALADNRFDCAICIRFLNWLAIADVDRALGALCRVSKAHLIIGVRTWAERISHLDRLGRGILRMKRLLQRRARRKETTIVHSGADVLSLFDKNALQVLRCETILAGPPGTRYCFYLLRKR
jgi:SAM-dependent methyltransferase